jgi:hypothetical protein
MDRVVCTGTASSIPTDHAVISRMFIRSNLARALRLSREQGSSAMSQKTVQLLIGQLLTDEELRLRFLRHPLETLTAFREQGIELTKGELEALVETDNRLWQAAARRIHPRLQKCSLRCDKEGPL